MQQIMQLAKDTILSCTLNAWIVMQVFLDLDTTYINFIIIILYFNIACLNKEVVRGHHYLLLCFLRPTL